MLAAGLTKNNDHLNGDRTPGYDLLFNEVFSFLLERGVAGVALIRMAAGFGSDHPAYSAEPGLAEKGHLALCIEAQWI